MDEDRGPQPVAKLTIGGIICAMAGGCYFVQWDGSSAKEQDLTADAQKERGSLKPNQSSAGW